MRACARPTVRRSARLSVQRRVKDARRRVQATEQTCSTAVVVRRTWKAVQACVHVAHVAWNKRARACRDEDVALAVKKTCVEMAPSGVKIAQALASRADLVGDSLATQLGQLQDAAPPFAADIARRIVAEELERSVEDVFTSFEDVPIGSASIAQVHRATLRDTGMVVAVKVQRPRASEDAMADAAMLNGAANVLKMLFPKKKRAQVVQELARLVGDSLQSELDFCNEAKNAAAFAKAHVGLPFVRVPRVMRSTKRVLISEWIEGWSPTELLATAGSDEKLEQLVRMGVACQCAQLFDTRLMHADPHPGNLLFTKEGCLVYLDFGLLLDVKKHHSQAMLAALVHIVNENWTKLADDLANMDLLQPSTNRMDLAHDLKKSIKGESNMLAADVQLGPLAAAIVKLALKYKFELPPYYSLLVRSLGMLEGIALSVDKDFKIVSAAYPYITRRLIFSEDPHDHLLLKELVLEESGTVKSSVAELLHRYAEGDASISGVRTSSVATRWLEKERAWGIERVVMDMDAHNLVDALDKIPLKYARQASSFLLPWNSRSTRRSIGPVEERLFELAKPLVVVCTHKIWQESKWLWLMSGFKLFLMWARSTAATLREALSSFITRLAMPNTHSTSTMAVT